MPSIYCCGSEGRRAALRAYNAAPPMGMSAINAIDYLVVVVGDSPDAVAGKSVLTVQFITTLSGTWSAANVSITGGLRGTTLSVDSTSTPTTSTLKIIAALPQDNGQYTLTLTPPAGVRFDLHLAAIDFYFQNSSITSVDCQGAAVTATALPVEPPIDYLAKDYSSFRRLMLDRLAALSSDWLETNAGDLGIALVEILAYAADHLSYYQDAIATEAYLGTARKRISVGRHARLLGYSMHEGCNARALVCVAVSNSVTLSPGSAWFLSRCQGQQPQLAQSGAGVPVALLDGFHTQYQAQIFEPMHTAMLQANRNVIQFYTWGDAHCCLPAGATRASLLDSSAQPLGLQVNDILILTQVINPQTGRSDDIDPKLRYPVRLTRVTANSDILTGTPVLDVEWGLADALPTSLVVTALVGTSELTGLSVALGNVILVDHGQTIPSEALSPSAPTADAPYRPMLGRPSLTFRNPQNSTALQALSATQVQLQDPQLALPAITCTAPDSSVWQPVSELLHSRSTDRQFVVEVDDDDNSILRFGDGTLGQAPPSGLVAGYRVGNGTAGNVAAEAIYHLVAPDLSRIVSIRNPLPAQGGTDPELISEVRLNVPQAFRTQDRAVTAQDYEQLTTRFSDVQRAAAIWRWTGAYRTIFITPLRLNGQVVDSTFKQNLLNYLERYRLTGTEIVIEAPLFVALDISLTVYLADSAVRRAVSDSLSQIFSDVDLPNGKRGFFHPDNFGFGQPVYLGQVLAAINQVPGVLWIDTSSSVPTNRFQRLGSTHNELDSGKIAIGHTELARLGSIPGSLSFGRIDFNLKGGL